MFYSYNKFHIAIAPNKLAHTVSALQLEYSTDNKQLASPLVGYVSTYELA